MLGDISQGGVRDQGDSLDEFVMVAHETEMGGHRPERFPAGKGRRLDDEACEAAGFCNKWIDSLCELFEVGWLERRLRTDMQNRVCGIEGVLNHR